MPPAPPQPIYMGRGGGQGREGIVHTGQDLSEKRSGWSPVLFFFELGAVRDQRFSLPGGCDEEAWGGRETIALDVYVGVSVCLCVCIRLVSLGCAWDGGSFFSFWEMCLKSRLRIPRPVPPPDVSPVSLGRAQQYAMFVVFPMAVMIVAPPSWRARCVYVRVVWIWSLRLTYISKQAGKDKRREGHNIKRTRQPTKSFLVAGVSLLFFFPCERSDVHTSDLCTFMLTGA